MYTYIKRKNEKKIINYIVYINYDTKFDDITCCRPNCISGSKLIIANIIKVDIFYFQWWFIDSHLWESPSSFINIYLLSVFCPINTQNARRIVIHENVSTEFYWPIIDVSLLTNDDIWRTYKRQSIKTCWIVCLKMTRNIN